jgi:CheY-like chemotaxis protein
MTSPDAAPMTEPAGGSGILVISEGAADAILIKTLLEEDFADVLVKICPAASVAADEFRELQPKVLLLAFKEIDKAEQCYLGLYRCQSAGVLLPHRTVLLCTKEAVKHAFELCRRGLFDDYVLFWPMTYDAPRLRMTVHRALAELAAAPEDTPSAMTIAAQGHRILELEALLARQLLRGQEHIAAAGNAVDRAERHVGSALGALSSSLMKAKAEGGPSDYLSAAAAAINLCSEESVMPQLRQVSESLQPLAHWAGELQQTVSAHREASGALGALSARLRPVVLIVDDDPFQQELLSLMLEPEGYQVRVASSGAEALRQLCRSPADFILMDFNLPDLNGIEVTKRLKGDPRLSAIPVIMITGNSERDVVVGSRKIGVADFIVKPVERSVILDKLRRHRADPLGPQPLPT